MLSHWDIRYTAEKKRWENNCESKRSHILQNMLWRKLQIEEVCIVYECIPFYIITHWIKYHTVRRTTIAYYFEVRFPPPAFFYQAVILYEYDSRAIRLQVQFKVQFIVWLIKKFILIYSYSSSTSTTILCNHMSTIHKFDIKTHREENKQKKLTEIFLEQKKPSSSTPKDEKFILARQLVIWFCRDLLPFCTVENHGFSNFWKSLNNSTKLPTRANVSVNALDDVYNMLKQNLLLESKSSPGKSKFSA